MAEDVLPEALASDITDLLAGLNNATARKMTVVLGKYARRFLLETQGSAPRGNQTHPHRPHFASQIALKHEEGMTGVSSYLWYVNAPSYRLTHLLERGHDTYYGKRVEGTHFIERAQERVFPAMLEELKTALAEP